jgi:trehalose-phosphatase
MKYLLRNLDEMKRNVHHAQRIYVMVDYDGTITPIAKFPRLAKIPADSRRLLRSLASHSRCVVAIVSGRSLENIRRMVSIPRAYYLGNHGLQIAGPRVSFTHSKAMRVSHELPGLSQELDVRLRGMHGLLIEQKGLTISVHYRNVAKTKVPRILQIGQEVAQAHKELQITHGKKVIEFRPRVRWGKGSAARWIMKQLGPGFPMYFGDDLTDEDAFSSLKAGMTVLVSESKRRSRARYYVKNVGEVQSVLRALLNTLNSC